MNDSQVAPDASAAAPTRASSPAMAVGPAVDVEDGEMKAEFHGEVYI